MSRNNYPQCGRAKPFLYSGLVLAAGLVAPLAAPAQTGADQTQPESDQEMTLEPVVVSTTRTETTASDITRSVTVVSSDEIQQQSGLDRNVGSILAKKVPGLSPSTEAVSSYGQSLRGRNFLVLIDGVPQSTPLQETFRDLNTIDPAAIERIEIVRGATATYGFGAAGGMINVITKEPSSESFSGYSQAGVKANIEEDYETTHRVSGTNGDWDYLASGTWVDRNGRFDSKGRRIPPNPIGAQGGFSDSDQGDFLGKVGREFDGGRQRLEFALNHFDLAQNTDYTFGAASPGSNQTPAILKSNASGDRAPVVDPGTENTVARTTYFHRDILGGSLKLNSYFGNQEITFPKYPGFPQNTSESKKMGSRLTLDTPIGSGGTRLSWGADILSDETSREYHNSQNISPDMEQTAVAVFGQAEVPIGNVGLIRGGVRHEDIAVDVDSLESNRVGNTISAGTIEYSETLPNLGGVLYLTETDELFANYSKGFTVSSIGRVITDHSGGDANAEDFESEAETIDNYEIGVRGGQRLRYSVAAFYSESDNGTTFDANLNIQKFEEEIHGIETSLDYDLTRRWMLGGTASWAEGERKDENGNTVDLNNRRISPPKVTAYADFSPSELWNARLQVLRVGDRDPDTPSGGDVDGYTLTDLTTRISVGPGDLRLSVNNLFNENYNPVLNQHFDSPTLLSKGPGRTFGASYEVNW